MGRASVIAEREARPWSHVALAVLLSFASVSSAAAADREPLPIKRARALDQVWTRAIEQRDRVALRGVLAPDIVVVSGSGALRDREAEIADEAPADAPPPVYFRSEVIRARMEGRLVFLVGTLRWRSIIDGRTVDFVRRYTAIYGPRRGGTMLVHLQISGPVREQ